MLCFTPIIYCLPMIPYLFHCHHAICLGQVPEEPLPQAFGVTPGLNITG